MSRSVELGNAIIESGFGTDVITMADATALRVFLRDAFSLSAQPEQFGGVGEGFQFIKGFVDLRRFAVMRRETAIGIEQDLFCRDVFQHAVDQPDDVLRFWNLWQANID